MKKTLLISLIVAAFCSFYASGNNFSTNEGGISDVAPTFEKGDLVLNFGIGVGRSPRGTTQLPPLTFSVEYGLVNDLFTENLNLGIGGIFGFQTYTWFGDTYTTFSFGARATVHYPLVDDFDVHSGIMMGFRTNPGRMMGGVYIGGRYYFTDNIAVMAELGYGITYLNVGMAFKF